MNFNTYIASVDNAAHTALLTDVLTDALGRSSTTSVANLRTALATGGGDADDINAPTAVAGPTTKVRYEAITASLSHLPQARDLVDVAAGTTAGGSVAAGYLNDVGTTADVEENLNGASQVRIAVSSNVKARN